MSTTSVNIAIQPIKKNQSVEEWRRSFKASVTLLEEKQAIALLPTYVCRTKGDRILAEVAAKESTLTKALDKLQTLIDGEISEFTWMDRFCNAKPEDTDIPTLTAFFFEITDIAVSAGLPAEKAVLRFLNVIPSGKVIYRRIKGDITANMDDDALVAIFTKIQPLLTNKALEGKENVSVKNDPERESFLSQTGNNEVAELRGQLEQLQQRFAQALEPGTEESEMESSDEAFYEKRKQSNRKFRQCKICNKKGHDDAFCWKRICKKCSGKGHDADKCPSKAIPKGGNL